VMHLLVAGLSLSLALSHAGRPSPCASPVVSAIVPSAVRIAAVSVALTMATKWLFSSNRSTLQDSQGHPAKNRMLWEPKQIKIKCDEPIK
jgi:hypothetical protein